MKKITALFTTTVLIASSLVASANVSFRWLSNSSTVKNDANVNLAAGSTVLIYASTDAVQNFNSSVLLASAYGDDVFMGSVATLYAGRLTTSFAIYGDAGAGGYVGSRVYAVVVATPFVSGVTPGAIASGAKYAYTDFGYDSLNSTDTLLRHDTTPTTPDQSFTPTTLPVTTSLSNVPEPSSFALLGIGLGLVGLRRFRRK